LFAKHLTSNRFFSGSGRVNVNTFASNSSRFDLDLNPLDAPTDNSDVESEGDWLDVPQVPQATEQHLSRMSEAVVIEVRLWLSLWFQPHNYFNRDQCGVILSLLSPFQGVQALVA
jgi:hypothetical protein